VGRKQKLRNLCPSGLKKTGALNLVSQALRGQRQLVNVICLRKPESLCPQKNTQQQAVKSEKTLRPESRCLNSLRRLRKRQLSIGNACIFTLPCLIYDIHPSVRTISNRVEHVKTARLSPAKALNLPRSRLVNTALVRRLTIRGNGLAAPQVG
jgi:hypothetical protein